MCSTSSKSCGKTRYNVDWFPIIWADSRPTHIIIFRLFMLNDGGLISFYLVQEILEEVFIHIAHLELLLCIATHKVKPLVVGFKTLGRLRI